MADVLVVGAVIADVGAVLEEVKLAQLEEERRQLYRAG